MGCKESVAMSIRCPKCREELEHGMFKKDVFGMRCVNCHLEWDHETINKYRSQFLVGDREPLP